MNWCKGKANLLNIQKEVKPYNGWSSPSLLPSLVVVVVVDLPEKNSKDICFEDVLMEILEIGGNLTMVDHDSDGEYTRSITMEDMLKNMDLACEKQTEHCLDMINEQDDAVTADVILQMVFFKDVIFG